jgi:hypothetical protein
MVTNRRKHSEKTPVKQGPEEIKPEANKIGASTRYDFNGKNLTPYGGLLPVITMLEKLGFQSLVEQVVTSKRIPRAMDLYRFVLGIVLGLYIGFPRLNQLRFMARDLRRFEVENLARIIDRVGVDQQRSDDAAKLQQGVPVPTIARQPRRLNAEDRANPPIAECAQEPFKAWP